MHKIRLSVPFRNLPNTHRKHPQSTTHQSMRHISLQSTAQINSLSSPALYVKILLFISLPTKIHYEFGSNPLCKQHYQSIMVSLATKFPSPSRLIRTLAQRTGRLWIRGQSAACPTGLNNLFLQRCGSGANPLHVQKALINFFFHDLKYKVTPTSTCLNTFSLQHISVQPLFIIYQFSLKLNI